METVEHAALQKRLFQVSSFIYNGRSENNVRERQKINLCSLYNFNLIRSHIKTVVGSVLPWKVHKNISEGNLITLQQQQQQKQFLVDQQSNSSEIPMKVLSRKKWMDFAYFYTKNSLDKLSRKPREPHLCRPLHLAEVGPVPHCVLSHIFISHLAKTKKTGDVLCWMALRGTGNHTIT